MFDKIGTIIEGSRKIVTSEGFVRNAHKTITYGAAALGVLGAFFGIAKEGYDRQRMEENIRNDLEQKYYKDNEEEKEES